MKFSKNTHNIVSLFITMSVIFILVLAGPASAVSVDLSNPGDTQQGDDVNFSVTVDIQDGDSYLPVKYSDIMITGPNGFKQNCRIFNNESIGVGDSSLLNAFFTSGEEIECDIDLEVEILRKTNFGYGYGYGYDAGYGYNFGYGYGYGYGYGVPGTITYNVVWHTDEDQDAGNYKARAGVLAESQDEFHIFKSDTEEFKILDFSPEIDLYLSDYHNLQMPFLSIDYEQEDGETKLDYFETTIEDSYVEFNEFDTGDVIGKGFLKINNDSFDYDIFINDEIYGSYYGLSARYDGLFDINEEEMGYIRFEDDGDVLFNIKFIDLGKDVSSGYESNLIVYKGIFRNPSSAGEYPVYSDIYSIDDDLFSMEGELNIIDYEFYYCGILEGMLNESLYLQNSTLIYDERLDYTDDSVVSLGDLVIFSSILNSLEKWDESFIYGMFIEFFRINGDGIYNPVLDLDDDLDVDLDDYNLYLENKDELWCAVRIDTGESNPEISELDSNGNNFGNSGIGLKDSILNIKGDFCANDVMNFMIINKDNEPIQTQINIFSGEEISNELIDIIETNNEGSVDYSLEEGTYTLFVPGNGIYNNLIKTINILNCEYETEENIVVEDSNINQIPLEEEEIEQQGILDLTGNVVRNASNSFGSNIILTSLMIIFISILIYLTFLSIKK